MNPALPVNPADAPGPLAFVADLDRPGLDPSDRHHLERVLRLRRGAPFTVADGRGRWRTVRLGPTIEPTGPVLTEPEPAPALTVGVAMLKGDRPELVVQKLTELGVDRIAFFAAERSIVRRDPDRSAQHLRRLRAVARAAAMQSHRARLPMVDQVELAELAALPGVLRADRGGPGPVESPTAVVVGPEGGWSGAERAAIPASMGLGEHVLRAESAAIAAASILEALRRGLVAAQGPGAPPVPTTT